MNYNKFIKVFKEQYGEIRTSEIMKAGFSSVDIKKLVDAHILRKVIRGIYVLDYKKEVNDYLALAKKSEAKEDFKSALQYYDSAQWLNDDERMPFIYYRKLWLLIKMDNYDEAIDLIEKIINMKNTQKYYSVLNIVLKLLAELKTIDPKLIAKTEGYTMAIKSNKISKEAEEYLKRTIYNIEKGCYSHAEYLVDKAMEISNNQPFYVFKLFKLLLSNVCIHQKEEEDGFTVEGKRLYNDKINELEYALNECLDSYEFSSAKKIVDKQLNLIKTAHPTRHSVYKKVIVQELLDAVIAIDNGTFENREYSFEGMDLSDYYIFYRSIETGDLHQACKHFIKENDDQGFTSNLRKLFAYLQMNQHEELEPELQTLIDGNDINSIKEYVEATEVSAYNRAMEYLRLARICYQDDKLDLGDQISSLVKPNEFRAIKYQGPLRQEKAKVQSIKEVKIRKREK